MSQVAPVLKSSSQSSPKSRLILITGMSCSGKTTLAKTLTGCDEPATHVSLDWFYKDLSTLLPERAPESAPESDPESREIDVANVDVDHPDAFDWERVRTVVRLLLSGIDVVLSTKYSFTTFRQEPCEQFRLKAGTRGNHTIVFEGIFAAHDDYLRERCDSILFVDTPLRECFSRREDRDVKKLGRDVYDVIYRWETFIVPSYNQYIEPYKTHQKTVLVPSIPHGDSGEGAGHPKN